MDIDSIPVVLSVEDAPMLLPLGSESERFGGPLHPVIQRYIRGAVPAPVTLQYTVRHCISIPETFNPHSILLTILHSIPFHQLSPFHSNNCLHSILLTVSTTICTDWFQPELQLW